MTRLFRALLLLLVAAAPLAACSTRSAPSLSAPPGTASAQVGALRITGAYIPEPASPDVAAAYFTVTDSGAADALVNATTPVAPEINLHQTVGQGTNAEAMVPLSRLPVPAHGSVALSLGHDHLMLMNPSRTLALGDTVSLTLTFAHAGTVTIGVPVVPNTGPGGTPLPASTPSTGMNGMTGMGG